MGEELEFSVFQKILTHLDVETEIGDIVRLGKYDENKRRTILLKVPNVWKRRLISSSARILTTFEHPVFLSRQLSNEEVVLENKDLMMRRELITKGIDPKDLRVKDGCLFRNINDQWNRVESTSND